MRGGVCMRAFEHVCQFVFANLWYLVLYYRQLLESLSESLPVSLLERCGLTFNVQRQ